MTDERENQNENENDPGNNEQFSDGERPPGIRLEVGLRPLSDLLKGLVEVNRSDLTTENRIENTSVNDGRRGQSRTSPDTASDSPSDRDRIDTRISNDEFIVVADLPGAEVDELSVGIDPRLNELVISRNDAVVGRIGIPWEVPEATQVRFNNGILEVHLRPKPI